MCAIEIYSSKKWRVIVLHGELVFSHFGNKEHKFLAADAYKSYLDLLELSIASVFI